MNWWLTAIRKYAVFSGRARRKEFWFFHLFSLLLAFCFGAVLGVSAVLLRLDDSSTQLLGYLCGAAFVIPSIAVSVRRLHDTGRNGWLLLLSLIPLIGAIILVVFYCQEGQAGPNIYGPDPKEGENSASLSISVS